jgi:hypothetical protein
MAGAGPGGGLGVSERGIYAYATHCALSGGPDRWAGRDFFSAPAGVLGLFLKVVAFRGSRLFIYQVHPAPLGTQTRPVRLARPASSTGPSRGGVLVLAQD